MTKRFFESFLPSRKTFAVQLVGLVALALVLVLFLYLVFDRYTASNIPFMNDSAFSFAVSDLLLDGHQILLGPPSHIGGRHLGPVYYWVVSFSLWVTHGNEYDAILVLLWLMLLACALTVLMASKLALPGTRLAAAAGTLLCLCGEVYLMQIREPWHGNFLFLPSACVLLSFLFALRSGPRYLPIYLLSASFLMTTHYGCAPLIAGTSLTLAAYWLALKHRGELPLQRVTRSFLFFGIGVPLCITLLLWLPLLIFELHYPSNLSALSEAFLKPHHQRAGLGVAITTLLGFLVHHLFITLHTPRIDEMLNIRPWCAVIGLSTIATGLLVGYLRHAPRLMQVFFAGSLVSVLLFICAASRAPSTPPPYPPIYEYYFNGLLPLPALFMGMVFSHALTLIKGNFHTLCSWPPNLMRGAASAGALLFLPCFTLFAIPGVRHLSFFNSVGPAYSYHTLRQAKCVSSYIKGDLPENGRASITTDSESLWMKNSYLYFLGRDYYGDMDAYGAASPKLYDYFEELSSLATQPSALNEPITYVVTCPYVRKIRAGTMFKLRHQGFTEAYDISIKDSDACGSCKITRLRRDKATELQ